jgi:nucleoid-associated protein YgaU
VGTRSSERAREIERAMRVHPAGRALRDSAGRRPAPAVPALAAPPGATPPPGRLRLTARGHLVVAVLALAAVTGGVAASGELSGRSAPAGLTLEGQSGVVVRPGDTLWSIASSVAGEDDVRLVVDRIQQVNALHGTTLVPGEVLRLP